MGTMHKLARHNYWRDGFKDQLTVAYKDALLTSVRKDTEKFTEAGQYLDSIVSDQFVKFDVDKKRIRKNMAAKIARREATRLIESADRRIVHWIFDPKIPVQETPFAMKFGKMLEGELQAY